MTNTTKARFPQWTYQSIVVMLGAVFLLWPALYNGYPMMNADAGTYLESGFALETPFDRPITYGLLIRLLSFNGISLWSLISIQAILVAAIVTGIVKQLYPDKYRLYAIGVMLVLSVGTGLPWLVCQVQPDVFTPIALLCMIRILLGAENRAILVSLYVLFLVSVAVHMSHPAIMGGTLVGLFLLRRAFANSGRSISVKIALMLLLSAASISVMGSALSKSKHVFLMGSLVEKGVLKQYLDDKCAGTSLSLCAYKNELPATANEFIWVNSSPLYKVGDWKGTKPEFNKIIQDIFTTPKYLGQFVATSAYATGRQLLTFGMGDGNIAFPVSSTLGKRVSAYLPDEAGQFQRSKQNRGKLLPAFSVPDVISVWVVAVSLVVMATLAWRSRKVRLVAMTCLIGILLNAVDTASFSCVQPRYGCRVMWLLPFCALVALIGKQDDRKSLV